MAEFLNIHPDNPQRRLVQKAVDMLHEGAVAAFPTDSCYALGCHTGDKEAVDRIRSIRQFDKQHNFTLLCADLSDIATYANVDNWQYRLLKSITPGPYTFILKATREVPRRLIHAKRRTIGVRIPEHVLCHDILATLGEPLNSVTLQLPEHSEPLSDPQDIHALLDKKVDLIIDGGFCHPEPTTVVNLSNGAPELIRQGKGAVDWL